MLTTTFFKLFPPPKYINIPYAGLDISDDAIRCIKYLEGRHGYVLQVCGFRNLKPGIVQDGYIKDEPALVAELVSLKKELKISTVKAALPEERMYLFKTEVPDVDDDAIRQNIEFKLEENVPLPASDAIFFFDRLPDSLSNGKTYASVSVSPKDLVNSYLKALQSAGITVVSFEIQAKAIGRSVVSRDSHDTKLIVNIMNKKTGLYIVSSGVICFTSTIPWGGEIVRGKKVNEISNDITMLKHEIERVCSYWSQHGSNSTSNSAGNQLIKSIIISGRDSITVSQVSQLSPDSLIEVSVANVWQNAFSINHYVPKVSFEDSLDYATAAGLALP